MSYNISSESLYNPLLLELLEKLNLFFTSVDSEYYIIGATARDIIMSGIHNQPALRMTSDLDIAIALPDWSRFTAISEALQKMDGFHKSAKQKQRFYYNRNFTIDIVPFGEVAKADNNIYWPPDEEFAMSVSGFSEVAKNALNITIDNRITVKVASLPGVFILKLAAFNDRKNITNKDADDMAFIIENYLTINETRAVTEHYDIYEAPDFNTFIAGAILLGRDINKIIHSGNETSGTFIHILETELSLQEESKLINQIIETHRFTNYETLTVAFNRLLQELKSKQWQ